MEDYNNKVLAAIDEYIKNEIDFAILGDGRSSDERSVVIVEKGSYKGYGYFKKEDNLPSRFGDYIDFITPQRDNSDIQKILKQYFKKDMNTSTIIYDSNTEYLEN
ncbi:MAG: hypothetical protein HRT72_10660 [Flavobacteriales bacterium]|nr:hypothetical protein [Flavobacteriales bacterium]